VIGYGPESLVGETIDDRQSSTTIPSTRIRDKFVLVLYTLVTNEKQGGRSNNDLINSGCIGGRYLIAVLLEIMPRTRIIIIVCYPSPVHRSDETMAA